MDVFSSRNVTKFARIASLAWWIYIVAVLSVFFGGMFLNYIVKKINEARLESRFTSLRNKGANQSTQVLRPIDIDNRATLPTGNLSGNLTKGISLVFNKEENRVEDQRRKDDNAQKTGKSDCVVITINSSENIDEEGSSLQSGKDEEMNKPAYLGTIYKELYEKRAAIEKSKSLSNADRDSILSEIVDRMICKINESKSTPSIKRLIDIDNESDLKDWALDLIRKKKEAPGPPASTSGQ